MTTDGTTGGIRPTSWEPAEPSATWAAPGIAISVYVLSLNLIGDGIGHALIPRPGHVMMQPKENRA